ncbi:MAG TPA: hypothetical protein VFX12_05830 [Vicinamibacterales bacterium]|nr:hypothetical protein [Vicinamibacterales bacterium]
MTQAKLWNRWAIAALAGLAAVAASGCADTAGTHVAAAASPAAAPIAVSCAPNQRAVVRPAVVNGVAMSQVECVATSATVDDDESAVRQAVDVTSAAPAVVASRTSAGDARIVPVSYTPGPTLAQQPGARAHQRVAAHHRSWQKSAVIIGGSTGVGAGLGAVIGGKKGALVGAALGGGGAAVWDQITRRK